MASSRFHFILACIFFSSTGLIKAAEREAFVGSVNCSTSGCHGGAGDLSKQHTVWFRADRHSRAHSTLTTARSLRMAESLKIDDPAQSQRCTSCHAPFATMEPQEKASTAKPEEGVSCESCHGPAASWVRSHTRPDYTRKQRISSGMRDLENLYLRANTCVACHQVIAPELIRAGHPKLHFNLAGLSEREPRHWKEIWSNPQLWVVGQFSSLRELSGSLSQSEAGSAERQADWESSLWICRILLETLPLEKALPSGSKPDQVFTQKCDALARQTAGKKWESGWNRPLLDSLAASLELLSRDNSGAGAESRALYLSKIHSGLRALSAETEPGLRVELESLLAKLPPDKSLAPAELSQQLPVISRALRAALQKHP